MSSADSQQEKENAPGVLTNFPNINSNDDNSEAGNKTRPLVETDQAEIMVIPASSSSPSLAGQEETGVNQSLGQAGLESSDINSSYHNLTRKLVKLKGFLVDQTSRINMQHQINERMFVTKDDYRCGVFDVYGIGNSDHDLQESFTSEFDNECMELRSNYESPNCLNTNGFSGRSYCRNRCFDHLCPNCKADHESKINRIKYTRFTDDPR